VASNTAWTVDENNSWLSVSPASSNGNGTITVSYDTNPDNEPRIGQIAVSSEGGTPVVNVTVNQAGASMSCGQILDDRDGQTYNTVVIGNQCWMKENLNCETGNSWCFYDNATYCDTYGRLYDWNTAMTACPSGWHLPSIEEWISLSDFLGGNSVAGGKMKETGTTHWAFPNNGATNSSDFSGLPGGYKHPYGQFDNLYYHGNWWSSSTKTTEFGVASWLCNLSYQNGNAGHSYANMNHGYSVRCLKN